MFQSRAQLQVPPVLRYSIHRCSGYAPKYHPENILTNKSNDQSSRWTSDSNVWPQYITLKLDDPAVLYFIKFGKFKTMHVCNLKRFRIYAGLTEDTMVEILDSGLKNNSEPEVFPLRDIRSSLYLPAIYLKIEPLVSWGQNFNFSIWFVELLGYSEPRFVNDCISIYKEHEERESIRICLKHLRQQNFMEAYESLRAKSRVNLEDACLTELYTALVKDGDIERVESLLDDAFVRGYFGHVVKSLSPVWTNLQSLDASRYSDAVPGCRGGHQISMDPDEGVFYMFGGWNGVADLADFWQYNIATNKWTCLSRNTQLDGGPSPRSCHKMCIDSERKQIYVLGRFLENAQRISEEDLKSDFFVYDLERQKWTSITDDTAAMGGPSLIFDHQMALDKATQTIYVFGGKLIQMPVGCSSRSVAAALVNSSQQHVSSTSVIISSSGGIGGVVMTTSGGGGPVGGGTASPSLPSTFSTSSEIFSGLYAYNIPTNTWTLICPDCDRIRSRIGHSMLFHSRLRQLFIFGGQRQTRGEVFNDFFTYNVDSGEVRYLIKNSSLPLAGYTQRATIDEETDEIFFLSGMSKHKERKLKNSFWVYKIGENQWECLFSHDEAGVGTASTTVEKSNSTSNSGGVVVAAAAANASQQTQAHQAQPIPRFAHQLAYDPQNKVHYLFGGNPGKKNPIRLDDFWSLKMVQRPESEVLRKAKYLVRVEKFGELVSSVDLIRATHYLQHDVAKVVDLNCQEERREFQRLTSELFNDSSQQHFHRCSLFFSQVNNESAHIKRNELFDLLCEFYPQSMTQPKNSLSNILYINTAPASSSTPATTTSRAAASLAELTAAAAMSSVSSSSSGILTAPTISRPPSVSFAPARVPPYLTPMVVSSSSTSIPHINNGVGGNNSQR